MLKNKFYILTLLFFAALFTAGCMKENPTGPEVAPQYNYPLSKGGYYVYSVDSVSGGAIGSRSVSLQQDTVFYLTPYIHRIDSSNIDGSLTTANSYMRKSSGGVYIYVDTSALRSLIPDSLLPFISIDNEITLLSYPLQTPRYWPAYKIYVDFLLEVQSLIDFNGSYLIEESVTLNLNGRDTTLTAKKIQYDLKVSIPDAEGEVTVSTYRAFAWFVDGIGFVKLSGSNAVLALFSGGAVTTIDTEGESVETLRIYMPG